MRRGHVIIMPLKMTNELHVCDINREWFSQVQFDVIAREGMCHKKFSSQIILAMACRFVFLISHASHSNGDSKHVHSFNTLRPRQDDHRFPNNTFERIFLNENIIILIKISLTVVLYGPINNIPSLVQIMAWRRSGDKPLSEPMMGRSPTHICVTRPQWVKWYNRTYYTSNLHHFQ